MKENFVIREERHRGARAIASVSGMIGIFLAVGSLIAGLGTIVLGGEVVFAMIYLSMMIWCLVFFALEWIINIAVKDCFIGGFDVVGVHVKVEVTNSMQSYLDKITNFTVNNRSFPVQTISDASKVNASNLFRGKSCRYACAPIEGGHNLELIVGYGKMGDVPGTYMRLDNVIVVESGLVDINKIQQILQGSAYLTTPQPLPVDIGGVPPYHAANDVDKTVAPRNKHYAVIAETGALANRRFDIASELVFGRDARECSVVFPADTAGVSRVHCKLVVEGNELCLYDLGSTYGTIVNNKMKLTANQMMHIKDGDKITIGDNQTFVVSIN